LSPSNAINCGPRQRAVFADGRSSDFCPISARPICELAAVTPQHVDAYFEYLGSYWSRISIRSAALTLQVCFRHCEAKGWVRRGLAAAILAPRIYRGEGLPLGPAGHRGPPDRRSRWRYAVAKAKRGQFSDCSPSTACGRARCGGCKCTMLVESRTASRSSVPKAGTETSCRSDPGAI
jgi:hypothetical protein